MLMLAMVGVCLPCAVHIWRDGRAASLRQVMACGLAMTVLHAALLLGGVAAGRGAAGHRHGTAAEPAAGAAGSAAEGLLAIVVLEITTALLAATLLARLRRR